MQKCYSAVTQQWTIAFGSIIPASAFTAQYHAIEKLERSQVLFILCSQHHQHGHLTDKDGEIIPHFIF
jgi:hypothetical protein